MPFIQGGAMAERTDQKNTFTPDISLNNDAIEDLKEIFKYTKILTTLINKADENTLNTLFKNNTFQHAVIFLFKAIGACIDKATKNLNLTIDQTPIFWKNLHYLRNALIHHLNATTLPEKTKPLLISMCMKVGHIYRYFSLVVDAKNTNVNLGMDRYKVFLDIHKLTETLKIKYPKEKRAKTPQLQYLKIILNAINGIEHLTKNITLTAENIEILKNKDPIIYFALQNLLELIATISTPNPEYSVLTVDTRKRINLAHADADTWLRGLGDSRNNAMHLSICIDDISFPIHIENMLAFKRHVLSHQNFPALQPANSTATATHSTSSTNAIMQQLQPTPVSAHKPSNTSSPAPLHQASTAPKKTTSPTPQLNISSSFNWTLGAKKVSAPPKKGPSNSPTSQDSNTSSSGSNNQSDNPGSNFSPAKK